MAADALSRVFSALADPTRRDIVARLAVGDATVNELAEPYEVTVQAVSKHLKVLEDAGLVSRTREAQRRPVHLEAEVFDLMTKWIERYRRQAEERFRRLDELLSTLPDDLTTHPPTRSATDHDRSTRCPPRTHETSIVADPTSRHPHDPRVRRPAREGVPCLHRPGAVRPVGRTSRASRPGSSVGTPPPAVTTATWRAATARRSPRSSARSTRCE